MARMRNSGGMLDQRSGSGSPVRDFLGWFLRGVLILGAISMVASKYIQWNQEISALRLGKQRLKNEIAEQEKMLQSRNIELERLKDGRYILPRARRLGMRPPTPEQFVRQMQIIDASPRTRAVADTSQYPYGFR